MIKKNNLLYTSIIFTAVCLLAVVLGGCGEKVPAVKHTKSALTSKYNPEGKPLQIVSRATVSPNDIIPPDLVPNHVRGAHLYDDLTIEAGKTGLGDNPLAAFAVNNADLAGDEGWKCSSCHGYDYEGREFLGGAMNNLLELKEVRGIDEPYVYATLTNGFEILVNGAVQNVHNYSTILTNLQRADLGDFTAEETFDTHVFLKAAAGGTVVNGMELMAYGGEIWNGQVQPLPPLDGGNGSLRDVQGNAFDCATCHNGGSAITDAQVHQLAKTDPWFYFYRVLWGSPRAGSLPMIGDQTVMPGLFEIIKVNPLYFGEPEDGAAVLAYSQMQ
ncbi:MAG: hypothetical protein OEZ43_14255 [Gammaproteobacteria bacterium]|nr:hypothetical protein [Gammaproteobacteria bacterium]